MLFNARVNSSGKSLTELKTNDIPKLSAVAQESSEVLVSDIHAAIERVEDKEEGETKGSCILPRTTFEYEKSQTLSKIKAIRGISPSQDISVKLPDGSEHLLVSKVYCDSRFKAIAQAIHTVDGQAYKYLRIKSQRLLSGKSASFKTIYIV